MSRSQKALIVAKVGIPLIEIAGLNCSDGDYLKVTAGKWACSDSRGRRLFDDSDVRFSDVGKQKAGMQLVQFVSEDSDDEIEISGDKIMISKLGGSTMTLPRAVGSGRNIRFHFKRALLPNKKHMIEGHTSDSRFEGVLLIRNIGASLLADALRRFKCNSFASRLVLNSSTGGWFGGSFEVVDIATNKWLVSGNLVANASVTSDPCK
jgi:hypothetical protein